MPVNVPINTPGTYTVEDDGIRGNGISVVRNAAGVVVFTIVHPADSVTFTMGSAGVNLIFNVLDSFGVATVTVGNLASSAESPDSIVVNQLRSDNLMTLVSNGSITEAGNDAAADIVANSLVMSAVTGIGTAANALDTQIVVIEAETTDGGINVANLGILQIGGLSAAVDGLDVVNSGNLTVSTTGFIFLSDSTGPEMVHGGDLSGDVVLSAIGANADIFTNVDRPAVSAPGGAITLNAGRDIGLGSAGTNFNNDVLATTGVTINVGRDFLLDGTANIRTGAFGGVVGGPISIVAGRNIILNNATGGLQTIQAFEGSVTLTTGPGGAFIERAAFAGAVQNGGNFDINLNADIVQIFSGGLNTTGIGAVNIRPATPGRPIELGTASDPTSALALSEAELDLLFTLDINIGDANSGPVDFNAPVSPNTFPTNLIVRSGTEILVRSSITLDGSLTLLAGNDLFFTAAGSFTTTNGGFTGQVDDAQDDGGLGGVGDLGGTFNVTAPIVLSGNLDGDILNGSNANDLLEGLGGNDVLQGGGGDDELRGGPGNNTASYRSAPAAVVVNLFVAGPQDTAGAGIDTLLDIQNLIGSGFGDSLQGNSGANIIDGGAGNDGLNGLGGDDTLIGGPGDDDLGGGPGNDVLAVDSVGDLIAESVGAGDDRVIADVSYVLNSGAEVETLSTTVTGLVNLTGNEFGQTIFGNEANNVLSGGGGVDQLVAAGGVDTLDGGSGADVMRGGGDNDTYRVDNVGDLVFESFGQGDDTVTFTVSYTLAAGVFVETMATQVAGGTDPLNLTGNDFGQSIFGNAGANTLNGDGGVDGLSGLAGNDILIGGGGSDVLNGGADRDGFFFLTSLNAATNVDIIVDFVTTVDGIALDDAVFTALAPGALPAGAFRIGASAADADDRIIYNNATGALFYDPDGVGGTAQVQFAVLQGAPALAGSDFVVI